MFGGMSIATDFTCALLPFLIVRHLQLDLRTRTVLCIILGLGVLTAAASIGKTITANVATNDPTYDIVHVEIWALFEDNFGIAIASAPSLRILFGSIRKTLSKKSSNPRTLAQGFSAFKFSITPRSAKSNATFPDEQESQDNLVPMGRVKKTTEVQVDISENLDLERRAQPDGFTPQKECIVND
ncbi:hypothetical protein MMC14_007921 [Varicellaria rhodocarpa]|nr:hypothetical protein [Varicellaria rhodocarpa]